jgi:hypothetical protein
VNVEEVYDAVESQCVSLKAGSRSDYLVPWVWKGNGDCWRWSDCQVVSFDEGMGYECVSENELEDVGEMVVAVR